MLGIDPGTATMGYGVVSGSAGKPVRLVECGVVRTRAGEQLSDRLTVIFDGVTELLQRHHPDAVAVE